MATNLQQKEDMDQKFQKLKQHLVRINNLGQIRSILDWDQQVYMPSAGTEERADQISLISEYHHRLSTSDELGKLLDELQPVVQEMDIDSDDRALVTVAKRNFDRLTKIPEKVIVEFTRAITSAHSAWETAKSNNDFPIFEPHLEKIVDLVHTVADCFQPYDHIYDVLMDDYEPGLKTKDLKDIFANLRTEQVELIKEISQMPQIDDSFLKQNFPDQKQWDFGMMVAEKFGIPWTRSRQDRSTHPFTTSFGQNDVRFTTHINERHPKSSIFSTMHESGHALYDLGFNPSFRGTPLSSGASSGFHESQSRMWENVIGRSKEFWIYFYPIFQSTFPSQLGNITLDSFYKAINKVEPSFIRIEADEATYNLHIMVRFEIETSLFEGKVKVNQLPELWNTLMKEYLGVTPPNNSSGVLQDIHWSWGMFGHFPTYTIGNLVSIQLWEKLIQDLPDSYDKIMKGDFSKILKWLRMNVHQFGAKYQPQDLIQKVTGSPMDPKPYINYLNKKYKDIYGL